MSREYQGRILAARGDLPGAEEALQEAIDLDKNNISPYLYLVQIYIQLNWKEQARSLLDSMVKNFSNDKRVYFLLATFETRQGNKKEALEAYVITSYSIHYTKLYDPVTGVRGRRPNR